MRIKISKTVSMSVAAMVLLAACHSHHSGGSGTSPYGATLTEVKIVRTADQQAMPVTGLPAQGATLTVR